MSYLALTPLDIAACYADYHVYNAVNTKLQSLPPDKDKDKKKKPDKKAVVKPRKGAELYQRKVAGVSAQAAPVCRGSVQPTITITIVVYTSLFHDLVLSPLNTVSRLSYVT